MSDSDPLGMQKCQACDGQGVIVQMKTDADGNNVSVPETCEACAGNGMVQGQSQ